MRLSLGLLVALGGAALTALACGSSSSSAFPNGGQTPDNGNIPPGFDGSSGGVSGGEIDVTTMHIDPPNATLNVTPGKGATQSYKLLGKLVGASDEIDLTSRAVFYVPDNYLVAEFPPDGSPTLATRVPAAPTDPPQRGGTATVQATIANADGPHQTTTGVTVVMTAVLNGTATPPLPANPAASFTGTPGTPDPSRAPVLAYPNDGSMFPPNISEFEVHWQPGSASNTLYQLTFTSGVASITYYTRCGGGAGFQSGACAFLLDQTGYAYLAASNAGAGDVTLVVRGSDDAASGFGASAPFHVQFAENPVNGGLYYFSIANGADPATQTSSIMRVDFGNPNSTPTPFLAPNQSGMGATCVGCHALSRDGSKLVASLGGQWDGRLVYLNDLSKANTDPSWLTQGNGTLAVSEQNRVQFASFNPDGTQFVAVYGDQGNVGDGYAPYNDPNQLLPNGSTVPTDLDPDKLFLHDGTTGLRVGSIPLGEKPDHPDWSPDGKTIAFTHVNQPDSTTQREESGSIDVVKSTGAGTWGSPISVIAPASGLNRFNPNFVPDSSFFYYTESSCAGPITVNGTTDTSSSPCDADADWSATTWAAAPNAGATPVHLDNAAKAGVADGANTILGDTFPRSTPFETKHRGGQLFWFTAASRRAVGLRTVGGAQHLWMFAVDPSKVVGGKDGSFTGFFLPFQDYATSNHIGQWTQKIVGGPAPPPPPPAPPPPPNPPSPH